MTRFLLRFVALACTFVFAITACKSGDDDTSSGGTGGAAPGTSTGGTLATGSGGVGSGTGGAIGAAGSGSGGSAALPPGNMPDATCLAGASGMNPMCDACACTPDNLNGCLTELTDCEMNADAMSSMLCKAIIDCAGKNKCQGAACLTPCMMEISTASSYMGMGDPLGAATMVGTCTMMKCGSLCP